MTYYIYIIEVCKVYVLCSPDGSLSAPLSSSEGKDIPFPSSALSALKGASTEEGRPLLRCSLALARLSHLDSADPTVHSIIHLSFFITYTVQSIADHITTGFLYIHRSNVYLVTVSSELGT